MGELWTHNGDEWVKAVPLRSNGVAHDPVFHVFRRSGSTWAKIWSKVTHPPAAPSASIEHHPSDSKLSLIHI